MSAHQTPPNASQMGEQAGLAPIQVITLASMLPSLSPWLPDTARWRGLTAGQASGTHRFMRSKHGRPTVRLTLCPCWGHSQPMGTSWSCPHGTTSAQRLQRGEPDSRSIRRLSPVSKGPTISGYLKVIPER